MEQKKAAERLNIGPTTLKKLCRELNIPRWPSATFGALINEVKREHEAMLPKRTKAELEHELEELCDKLRNKYIPCSPV